MFSSEEKITGGSQYFFYTPTETSKSLFLYPTVIGSFEYLPSYSLIRNRYDSYLIILIESGTMEILLDGKYLPAGKGDVILLNCYKPHAYRTSTGCKTLWLHFDGKMAGSYYDNLTQDNTNILTIKNFNAVHTLLGRLFRSFEEHSAKSEAQMSIMIGNILLELMSGKASVEPVQSGINKVTEYLTDNFSRDISLNEMAELAGFSPYYFLRRFKKETGLTPHQFLISARMSAAKYNLSNTGMTVSEIAYACGFEDESAFCYSFRKREGITPKEFRLSKNN
ncbi:transcriptional regulator AraC family [Butyrivibrio proteoclasticus B316]|uniref:Transcriptional regulator AraC family n=1 Tax=Butyrivibrio proteoclasticus (strain ATCC 51982 / DSM 14932 / B316) TaxID=515622 RepID=E0RXL1_BUTPB|nr:AraC family transcriptional regulator [Butyrivibrio proteoclasticus]ADL34438.1 transcriptional regulator AraC family [Butyrivibrio proteoclasticus B316]